jgi:hypothetical protein
MTLTSRFFLLFFCQTYDKTGGFHTGTPPPYGMAGNASAAPLGVGVSVGVGGPSPYGAQHMFIPTLAPHQSQHSHMMHQQLHQVVILLSDSLTFPLYRIWSVVNISGLTFLFLILFEGLYQWTRTAFSKRRPTEQTRIETELRRIILGLELKRILKPRENHGRKQSIIDSLNA